MHLIRNQDKETSLCFRSGDFTWSERVKRNFRQAVELLREQLEQCSGLGRAVATAALSGMARETYTCVSAAPVDVLSLQIQGKFVRVGRLVRTPPFRTWVLHA